MAKSLNWTVSAGLRNEIEEENEDMSDSEIRSLEEGVPQEGMVKYEIL